MSMPIWSGGAFLTIDSFMGTLDAPASPAPIVYVASDQGHATIQIRIPGAVWLQNRGVARGLDGAIAACGDAKDAAGELWPYLAIFAPNAESPTVVRTESYHPTAVTIAPDGTVWTKGIDWVRNAAGRVSYDKEGAGILRHFSRAGVLSGLSSSAIHLTAGGSDREPHDCIVAGSRRLASICSATRGATCRWRLLRSFPRRRLHTDSTAALRRTRDHRRSCHHRQ